MIRATRGPGAAARPGGLTAALACRIVLANAGGARMHWPTSEQWRDQMTRVTVAVVAALIVLTIVMMLTFVWSSPR
jgi:hypothetical protein